MDVQCMSSQMTQVPPTGKVITSERPSPEGLSKRQMQIWRIWTLLFWTLTCPCLNVFTLYSSCSLNLYHTVLQCLYIFIQCTVYDSVVRFNDSCFMIVVILNVLLKLWFFLYKL